MDWKPIERCDFNQPVWVLKYYMYSKDGCWVEPDTRGVLRTCSTHGWYETEEAARKAQNHFIDPSGYHIEKVYKRVLLPIDE